MALFDDNVVNTVPFQKKWNIFANIGNFMYIMVNHSNNVVSYAPLYVHSFRFLQPHFLADSEKFNITYPDPSQLTTVADKLRYYRYKNGLLQRDVADYAGIERTTYNSYEEDVRDYYPLDVLVRIAELFEVDITDLLDDYNAFLFHGQAGQLKAFRKRMILTQASLATKYGVNITNVKRWEQNKIRMTKKMWERIFNNSDIT